jgi:hypothetical protein
MGGERQGNMQLDGERQTDRETERVRETDRKRQREMTGMTDRWRKKHTSRGMEVDSDTCS